MDKKKEKGRRKRSERARKWREWDLIIRLYPDQMAQRSTFKSGGGAVAMAEGGGDYHGKSNEKIKQLYCVEKGFQRKVRWEGFNFN